MSLFVIYTFVVSGQPLFATQQVQKSNSKSIIPLGIEIPKIFSGKKNEKLQEQSSNFFDACANLNDENLQLDKVRELLLDLHDSASKRKDRSVNLFVGPTRSGKSTTIAYLLGANLVMGDFTETVIVEYDNQGKPIYRKDLYKGVVVLKDQNNSSSYPVIGHGVMFRTAFPKIFPVGNFSSKFNYYDMEGMGGMRTSEENKVISLFAPFFLMGMGKVNAIILTISYDDLGSRGGKSFGYCTNFLVQYLQSYPYEKLQESLFIAVTKLPKLYYGSINRLLQKRKQKLFNKESNLTESRKNEIMEDLEDFRKDLIEDRVNEWHEEVTTKIQESFRNALEPVVNDFFFWERKPGY